MDNDFERCIKYTDSHDQVKENVTEKECVPRQSDFLLKGIFRCSISQKIRMSKLELNIRLMTVRNVETF